MSSRSALNPASRCSASSTAARPAVELGELIDDDLAVLVGQARIGDERRRCNRARRLVFGPRPGLGGGKISLSSPPRSTAARWRRAGLRSANGAWPLQMVELNTYGLRHEYSRSLVWSAGPTARRRDDASSGWLLMTTRDRSVALLSAFAGTKQAAGARGGAERRAGLSSRSQVAGAAGRLAVGTGHRHLRRLARPRLDVEPQPDLRVGSAGQAAAVVGRARARRQLEHHPRHVRGSQRLRVDQRAREQSDRQVLARPARSCWSSASTTRPAAATTRR